MSQALDNAGVNVGFHFRRGSRYAVSNHSAKPIGEFACERNTATQPRSDPNVYAR